MAFFEHGGETLVFAAGPATDWELVQVTRSGLVSAGLRGSVSGLVAVDLRFGPRLVASGRFNDGDADYGLATWDGTRWRLRSPLLSSTVALREVSGRVFALGADRMSLLEYDGFQITIREIPLVTRAVDLALLDAQPAVCERTFSAGLLGVLSRELWQYSVLRSGCSELASQSVSGGAHLLVRSTTGLWTVVHSPSAVGAPPSLPEDLDFSTAVVSPGPGLLALTTPSQRRTTGQLAVWRDNRWSYPERAFTPARFQVNTTQAIVRNNQLLLVGTFTGPDQSSVFGVSALAGIGHLPPSPLPELGAFAGEFAQAPDGTVYGALGDRLWIGEAGQISEIDVPEGITSLAVTETGDIFAAGCGQSVFRLAGRLLMEVATLPDDQSVQCSRGLIPIDAKAPAGGIYVVAVNLFGLNFSGPPRAYRLYRYREGLFEDVSPPSLITWASGLNHGLTAQAVELDGEPVLAVNYGETVTYFDGNHWQSLRPLPGASGSGPVAAHGVSGRACFYVGEIGQLARYCGQGWERPASLALPFTGSPLDFRFIPFFQALTPFWQDGRPLLLVAGAFDAAGPVAQAQTALLDLDGISRGGFEFEPNNTR
ncbi:MAG: hypothetical protein AAGA23_03770 [Pseudomonadota bacterium]